MQRVAKLKVPVKRESSTHGYDLLRKDMLMAGETFGACFAGLFSPIGAEIDIGRSHPQALTTIDNLPIYRQHMEDLRETLTPEIELIDSRIISPVNDFTAVLKAVRKNITKRDHKVFCSFPLEHCSLTAELTSCTSLSPFHTPARRL